MTNVIMTNAVAPLAVLDKRNYWMSQLLFMLWWNFSQSE